MDSKRPILNCALLVKSVFMTNHPNNQNLTNVKIGNNTLTKI